MQTAVRKFMLEEIPASSGWQQVFGSVAVFLFLVQAFTGVLLAFNYAPTPGDSYNSLRYILTELTAGRLIRGLHHWGASMMIAVVVLHMVQVFLYGAYKKPREATWMVGVVLLLVTLAYGLTGYLLPWDNRAYWGTVVTTRIAASAPLVGPYLTRLLGVGGGGVGVVTFARFYGMHVLLLPPATILLIALHVYLVRKHGVARSRAMNSAPQAVFPGAGFQRHGGDLHRLRRSLYPGAGGAGAAGTVGRPHRHRLHSAAGMVFSVPVPDFEDVSRPAGSGGQRGAPGTGRADSDSGAVSGSRPPGESHPADVRHRRSCAGGASDGAG